MQQIWRVPSGPPQKGQASYIAQTFKELVQREFVYTASIGVPALRTAELCIVVGWNTHGVFS